MDLLSGWVGELDDFTEQTIAYTDAYLRQEAAEEVASIRMEDNCTEEELAAYNAILDEEHDLYWSQHCHEHGEGLQLDGSCASCEAELADERRNDA